MVVCAGNGEHFTFAKSIGVGLCESAIGLSQICLKEYVDSIVFIGSAGAYSRDVQIGDIYLCDRATQIELSFLEDKSYTPIDNCIQSGVLALDESVSHETFAKRGIVNSSNYITTDKNVALAFTKAGIVLENMEFFSVMRVAQYFHIPCIGVLCVSNYCDKNAHEEFMQNHTMVKQRLMAHAAWIQNLSYLLAKKAGDNPYV